MKKIKQQLRKAFTLVELVVVIAIVAALASILIPTFVNVLSSANESNDVVLAKNLDTSLITVESKIPQVNGVYNVTEALNLVRKDGYDVSKLTPTAENSDYVYNASTNRFLYYTDNFKTLAYGEEPEETNTLVIIDTDLTRVSYAEAADLTDSVQYCVYATYDEGADINNSDITVWLYTESGSSVTINLAGGMVYHYGEAANVDIVKVANNSYHLYGDVDNMTLTEGHVKLESKSKTGSLTIASTTNTKLTYSDDAVIESFNADSMFTAVYNENSTEPVSLGTLAAATGAALQGSENNPYEISNADDFAGMSSTINSADSSLTKVYLQLAKSIDMNDSTSTTPYAKLDNTVSAVLDLNGYTVKAYANKMILNVATTAGFTIKDGSKNQSGAIYAEDNTSGIAQFITFTVKNATLTLESGSIYSNNCIWNTALINMGSQTDGNVFIMNGGSIYVESTTIKNGAVIKLARNSEFTMNGGSISVLNSTIKYTTSTSYYYDNAAVGISATSTFTLNEGNISASKSIIYNGLVSLYANTSSKETTFIMNGGSLITDSTVKVSDDSFTPAVAVYNKSGTPSIIISGGTISAYNFCIAGNGDFTSSNSTIIIEAGSTLTSTTDYAIYNPQPGTVNVTGGKISGGAGAICMNRGTLNISGGELVCENTGNTGDFTSGTGTITNAVINLGAKYDAVNCNISGGTLTSNGSANVITVGTDSANYNVTLNVTAKVTVNGTGYSAIDTAYVSVASGYTLEDGTYSAE